MIWGNIHNNRIPWNQKNYYTSLKRTFQNNYDNNQFFQYETNNKYKYKTPERNNFKRIEHDKIRRAGYMQLSKDLNYEKIHDSIYNFNKQQLSPMQKVTKRHRNLSAPKNKYNSLFPFYY